MDKINDMWDLNPGNAHPGARQLLTDPLYWDFGNEDSPVGTDVGADTLSAYLQFHSKAPGGSTTDFIQSELDSRGLPDADWDLVDECSIDNAIDAGHGSEIVSRDDFIMGLAFAQIILRGEVDERVKVRALSAIAREATDAVLSFRGGDGEEGRRQQLAEMRRILESV
jgi:uncharacterized protein YfeS